MSDVLRHPGQARRRYRLAGEPSVPSGAGMAARFGSGADHVDDLVAAYALGALEPEEREQVERHCRACVRCARLVADERRLVGLLPLAAPSAVPAPDVKLALFARVAQSQAMGQALGRSQGQRAAEPTPPTSREQALLPPTLTIPASRPATPAPTAVPPPALAAERRSRFGWAGSALALPLLVALVATGAWGWQLRGQVAESSGQVSELEASLANFGSDATESLPLNGPRGQGELRIGADQQEAMLRMQVDESNAGMSYRFTGLNQNGQIVPLSELRADAQGKVLEIFPFEQSLDEYSRFSVEARPVADETGSGEPVMSGEPNGSIGSDDPTANSALPDS